MTGRSALMLCYISAPRKSVGAAMRAVYQENVESLKVWVI